MSVGANTTRIVTPEERERYERDGYLLIESSGCPSSVLDGITADLDGKYNVPGYEENGVGYYPRRILNGWRISENVKALALAPKVHSILEQLYGRKPLPLQTLNFHIGTRQGAHSDTLHFNCVPPGYMCGAWVALEDMDMDNGPVVYYPGSHKLHEITMQDVGVEPTKDEYPHYERYIADLIEREGLEPAYATIQKGQVFIWAANLLHGGSPVRDKSRSRHSQVTHYFFEGCKYYTPMASSPERVHWLDPEWIA